MVKQLALGDDNCNAFELATLRFVNADGVGKFDATNQFAVREEVFLPFKIDCDADAVVDARDSAEGAVQQAAVRIGEQMNDRFAECEVLIFRRGCTYGLTVQIK